MLEQSLMMYDSDKGGYLGELKCAYQVFSRGKKHRIVYLSKGDLAQVSCSWWTEALLTNLHF